MTYDFFLKNILVVSPQTSETVFTKTVTITDDGQPFEETAILSIEFGGPTQTVSGEIIDKGETQLSD